jgi:serine/threonine-protein kinase haspin
MAIAVNHRTIVNGISAWAGSSTAAVKNATSAFVETHGVGVCKGKYAADLTREWHAWDARHGSENDPVDAFPEDQLYIVFVVADGGVDLEHFEVRSFKEAKSILLQVG